LERGPSEARALHMTKKIPFLLLFLFAVQASAAELSVIGPRALSEPLTEITEFFERKYTDWKVNLRIGKSSELARLIPRTGSADVFLLNDDTAIQQLKKRKKIENVRPFVADDLVVIADSGSKLTITEPSKLVSPELKAVALLNKRNPTAKAARAYLTKMNLLESVEKKISEKKDLKALVSAITSKEADWGIAYSSDITQQKGVKIIWTIPDSQRIYYVGTITSTPHKKGANYFLETIHSTIALKLFENAGLRIVTQTSPQSTQSAPGKKD
jgi:molybdate transport system substrate-binding protein